jgi:pimeloyl-ACP methyl ester carboxylesterase
MDLFAKTKTQSQKIKRAVKETQTPVRLMYGKHDRIILPVVGERFRKGIEDYCTITIIEAGHQVLHNKHVDEIVNLILD